MRKERVNRWPNYMTDIWWCHHSPIHTTELHFTIPLSPLPHTHYKATLHNSTVTTGTTAVCTWDPLGTLRATTNNTESSFTGSWQVVIKHPEVWWACNTARVNVFCSAWDWQTDFWKCFRISRTKCPHNSELRISEDILAQLYWILLYNNDQYACNVQWETRWSHRTGLVLNRQTSVTA